MLQRRMVSLSLVCQLALLPACKQEAPPEGNASGTASPTPASDPTAPAAATSSTTTVGGSATPMPAPTLEPSYTAELDPLLDLVPADANTFGVVRDPLEFVDGFGWLIDGQQELWRKTLDANADPGKPDADAGMRRMLLEFDVVRAALAGSGVHLDKGMVFADVRDEQVTVFAADSAESVPALARALTTKPEAVELQCKLVAGVAGFVACSDDAAALAAYAPGKSGKALRERMTALLDADSIARGNVVSMIGSAGKAAPMTIMTAPGVLQTDVRLPDSDKFGDIDAPGPAAALGLLQPGNSFNWARLDSAALAASASTAPPMITNIIKALSGEMLIASPGSGAGVAVLVGITDPTPVAGLVPMAALAKDSIPPLPDGTKVDVKLEDIDDGSGGKVQVLRATVSPTGELATLREKIGLEPEVTAFVTKQWGVIAVGTGPAIVKEVVGRTASGPSPELLAALPPELARALKEGRASVVMHIELDGLHAPGLREQLAAAMSSLPGLGTGGPVPPGAIVSSVLGTMSPLSSLSVWGSTDAQGMVAHIALRSFGDPTSQEGKDAHAARLEVEAGRKDAATAYGVLASNYPGSGRAASYRARAGMAGADGAKSGAAIVGVLAAIAIPAFQQYMERAKKSG